MRRQTAGLAILAVFFASLVFAQTAPVNVGTGVPPVLRFSGTLAVAAGRVPVTFSLYAEQTGGEPLWLETQTVAIDATGRYAVLLGTATALSTELFVSGEAKWLGVRVEGQAEQPRVLLVSVPYALKAADAETIGGKPLSAFVLAGEKTGTAADGLTYLNPQALTLATKPLASGAGALPQSAGSPGYIGVFTDTVNLGNSVIFQSGSGIGIGTTTPAAPFHVAGTSAPAAYFDVYSNTLFALPAVYRAARGTPAAPSAVQTDDILGGLAVRGYMTTGFSAGRGQVMFKAAENWTDSANGTYLQFTTTPTGTANWAERMRITPAGYVGIGTTTPGQMLSVAGTVESTTGGFLFPDGTTQTTAARSGAGNNNAFGTLSLSQNTTGYANAAFGNSTLSANTTGYDNTAGGYSALAVNTTGVRNTATGTSALAANTEGSANTATGAYALAANTTGYDNTAHGEKALYVNTTGVWNTASGAFALAANTTGSSNTASGGYALAANTTGYSNTASGESALAANTTGIANTASGVSALTANTVGEANTATGVEALVANTTGNYNVASGVQTLAANTTGTANIASGNRALYVNTTGSNNTASGNAALMANTTGNNNIALGQAAGYNLTTGSNNIDIGNDGFAAEGNTIRIGQPGTQTQTFIAGIRGVTTSSGNAIAVLIDSNGQLGTVSSSRRVKDDITDMAASSSGLMQLRPVTFHYKADQNPAGRTLQYGLIAEEVAEVYPGLVAHSADGQIETVLYQFLPPMLLNEVQKQQRTIDAQAAHFEAAVNALNVQNDQKDEQIRKLTAQVDALTRAVATLGDRKQ